MRHDIDVGLLLHIAVFAAGVASVALQVNALLRSFSHGALPAYLIAFGSIALWLVLVAALFVKEGPAAFWTVFLGGSCSSFLYVPRSSP